MLASVAFVKAEAIALLEELIWKRQRKSRQEPPLATMDSCWQH